MPFGSITHRPLLGALFFVVLADVPADAGSKTGAEAPFLAANDTAMNKMMRDMSVKPTGDVDRDFTAMMIPHHQGAIDMAVAELKYGHNEQLKRIAQEIIVDQQQEIAAMRMAIGAPLPPSMPAPTQQPASAAPSAQTPSDMSDMPGMTHN